MTEWLRITTLALSDSLNPIAIGMVLEALLVRQARRQSLVFTITTVVINTIVAVLLIQGFDLISGLQQIVWPQVLIVIAGLALIAQGVYDAVKAYRNPNTKMWLWFSIANASTFKTIVIAIVVCARAAAIWRANCRRDDTNICVARDSIGYVGLGLVLQRHLYLAAVDTDRGECHADQ